MTCPLLRPQARSVQGQGVRVDRRQALQLTIEDGRQPSLALLPSRLCVAALTQLDVQGVGMALISTSQSRSLLASSGDLAGVVEDLQFSLGEGPCLDAFSSGAPVFEDDLAGGGRRRWPVFANGALAHGVRAVFSFPLQVGVARFGVLDVARDRPGALQTDELADALVLADIATEAVLQLQADSAEDQIADELGGLGSERIVVHQATGMISAQAAVDITAALARLRAFAYSHERTLHDVAQDVVARRLTFYA